MGLHHSQHTHEEPDEEKSEKFFFDHSFFAERLPQLKGKSKTEIAEFFKRFNLEVPEKEIEIATIDLQKVFEELTKWLANLMNPVIAESSQVFINWSDTQKIENSFLCSPRTKDDIRKILNHPEYKGKQIGLLGSTHTWDNFFGTDGAVLINFKLFNAFAGENEKKVRIVNKEQCIIDISAGCSILEKHGLLGLAEDPMLLPSCVIYTDGQYTGISATACHGCSFNDGSLSDRIRKITFLDSTGEEHILDIEKDERALRAGAIGLGSYGIITDLQFKMVPEMLVVTESHYWTLSQMKYHLINRSSDWISFEHYWWPFGSVSLVDAIQCMVTGTLSNYDYQQDKVYCRIVRHYRNPNDYVDPQTGKLIPKYDKKTNTYVYPDPQKNKNPNSIWRNEFPYYFQEVLLWLRKYVFIHFENKPDHPQFGSLGRFVPLVQVFILELLKILQFWQEFGRPRVSTFFNAVHYLPLVSSLPVRLNDIELCFKASSQPVGPGVERESFDNYFEALNELGMRIQDEAYYGRFPVNMCVESRICAASPCPLAACYLSGEETPQLFAYLEILSFIDTPTWKYFGNEFFQVMKSIDPNVKPALGKQWVLIDGIYEHLREVCKEGLAELKKLQQKYDKTGRFMTPAVAKLF